MKIIKLLPLVLLIVVVSFSSCEKEGPAGKDGINGTNGTKGTDGLDGTDGIDGKDGTDGKDGKDGVDGQDGKDGKDGTAQLKIYNFSVVQANWITVGTAFQPGAFTVFDYLNPQITSKMIDSGMIMVYFVLGSVVSPLPRTSFTGTGVVINTNYEASQGKISLRNLANDWGHYSFTGTSSFRVVIIPASVAMAPDFSWDNYEEVVKRCSAKE